MKPNQLTKEFLSALFDSDDYTCFSKNPYGINVHPLKYFGHAEFFCINALQPKTTRSDANVLKHRNILIELDTGTLKEQEYLIEEQLKMPYTSKVYSGGKSLHYIISIEDFYPVSKESYTELALDIFAAVPGCDTSVKNPSRFSRLGDALRVQTGVIQEVLNLKDRVKNSAIEEFLFRNKDLVSLAKTKRQNLVPETLPILENLPENFRGDLTKRTKDFIKEGAAKGERNPSLYFSACDFKNNFYSLTEALDLLGQAAQRSGLSAFETTSVIQSAYARAGFRPRIWEGKK